MGEIMVERTSTIDPFWIVVPQKTRISSFVVIELKPKIQNPYNYVIF